MKYFVAFIACATELVLYGLISALLDLNKGGRSLSFILLFSLLSITWSSIIAAFDKSKTDAEYDLNEDNLSDSSDDAKSQLVKETVTQSYVPDVSVVDGPKLHGSSMIGKNNLITPKTAGNEVETTDAPCNDHEATDTKKEANNEVDDFNTIIKIILIVMMVSSCIFLISQLVINITLQDYGIAAYQFIGGLINLFAFILIYKKKIWGAIIFAIMMILQVPLNILIVGTTDDIELVLISAFVRIIIISLVLLIRHNGKTGWSVLIKNSKKKGSCKSGWKSMLEDIDDKESAPTGNQTQEDLFSPKSMVDDSNMGSLFDALIETPSEMPVETSEDSNETHNDVTSAEPAEVPDFSANDTAPIQDCPGSNTADTKFYLVKITSNVECTVFLDCEKIGMVSYETMIKRELKKGPYILRCISIYDEILEHSFELDKDELFNFKFKKTKGKSHK